jgi:hypothetical protein
LARGGVEGVALAADGCASVCCGVQVVSRCALPAGLHTIAIRRNLRTKLIPHNHRLLLLTASHIRHIILPQQATYPLLQHHQRLLGYRLPRRSNQINRPKERSRAIRHIHDLPIRVNHNDLLGGVYIAVVAFKGLQEGLQELEVELGART